MAEGDGRVDVTHLERGFRGGSKVREMIGSK